jgi:hydrogenase nickel incorporation protein HypB
MCATCGCSDDAQPSLVNMQTGRSSMTEDVIREQDRENGHTHPHDHDHEHGHTHPHDHDHEHGHLHSHDHDHEHGHSDSHDHDHDHRHSHSHDDEHGHGQTHSHDHEHGLHSHDHRQERASIITLEENILGKNNQFAERNRKWLEKSNILALNLVSSPGSGKTALLERTIKDLQKELIITVVEGDQATLNDAIRIKNTGCEVIQINTGAGCHLDAVMIKSSLEQLKPPEKSVLFIENVGNLVCPALFDLGEKCKVAILSVTEGEDKPIKYPHMFRAAEILLLNKIDLLPYLKFDIEACKQYAKSVNPRIKIFEVSAISGEGMSAWYEWIKQNQLVAGTACKAARV